MSDKTPPASISLRWIILTLVVLSALLAYSVTHARIDFDVLNSLPTNDPVINDAKYVLEHHPFQNRVVIDISHTSGDLVRSAEGARFIEEELQKSTLFKEVGLQEMNHLFAGLTNYTVDHLPFLFSYEDLFNEVRPLLEEGTIREKLQENFQQLAHLQGIGQVEMMTKDPLRLREIVLSRLSGMLPGESARLYEGFPLSGDGEHLLIPATPKQSGTDTYFSQTIANLLAQVEEILKAKDPGFRMVSIGAYRAALDNESIIRNDTQKALIIVTAGIALLLFLAFRRPYIGLLSLIPAFVGTALAFFICTLIYSSVSILAIGFGAAIISISVDHSLAYLLFLDRSRRMVVRDAAHEVRSIGLIAVLTTVGAFLVLTFSGFKILAQIGQFAALGIGFSFLFVHTLFPKFITSIPAAKKQSLPLLQRFIEKLSFSGNKILVFFAIAFAIGMALNIDLRFDTDLSRMNSISEETQRAEEIISNTWGGLFGNIFVLAEADTVDSILSKSEQLTEWLKRLREERQIGAYFTPSMLFPSKSRMEHNYADWKWFWNDARKAELKTALEKASDEIGFAPDAFRPFLSLIDKGQPLPESMPKDYLKVVNVSKSGKNDQWLFFSSISPGEGYEPGELYRDASIGDEIYVFEPLLFSEKFGSILSNTFLKMMLLIGSSVIILMFLFFLDLKLTAIAILPVLFSMTCTLGTLGLIGHPIDIPGLMLGIVVMGMGIDYSLFLVRSFQRYEEEHHPSMRIVRTAVLLAAISTLIGFGVLAGADHNLLYSAGLVSLLGIGYSLLGAFVILPPILNRRFLITPDDITKWRRNPDRSGRVLKRYSKTEAYPRMFARFKLKLDPMFGELDRFISEPGVILDIGTGYGVPACWILDQHRTVFFHGVEPDRERARIADKVLGASGHVTCGAAPDIPSIPRKADYVVMLDMLHYLDRNGLRQTLLNVKGMMHPGAKLIIRVTIPLKKHPPFYRRLEQFKIRLRGGKSFYRPSEEILEILGSCGFQTIETFPPGKGREETWITANIGGTDTP